MPKKLNFEDLKLFFNKKHQNKYDYSKSLYQGINIKIEIICPKHGPFFQTPESHKLYGCIDCGKERQKQYYDSKKKIYSKSDIEEYIINCGHQYQFNLLKDVYKSSDKIDIVCKFHNNHNGLNIKDIFCKKDFCIHCKKIKRSVNAQRPNYKNRLSFDTFLERIDNIFPHNFYSIKRICSGPFSLNEMVEVVCHRHDLILNRKARNILSNRCACFKCNNSISVPEMIIFKTLEEYNYTFEFQKIFDELKIGYKKYLRVDFYIPLLNLIIEYDGEQHFKPLDRGHNISNSELLHIFNKTQENDKRKNDFAKNNDIFIERIPYTIKNSQLKKFLLKLLSKYE